jgi:hypothetical protein
VKTIIRNPPPRVKKPTEFKNPRTPDSFLDRVWVSVTFVSLDEGEGPTDVLAAVVGCCVDEGIAVAVGVDVGIDLDTRVDVGPCVEVAMGVVVVVGLGVGVGAGVELTVGGAGGVPSGVDGGVVAVVDVLAGVGVDWGKAEGSIRSPLTDTSAASPERFSAVIRPLNVKLSTPPWAVDPEAVVWETVSGCVAFERSAPDPGPIRSLTVTE